MKAFDILLRFEGDYMLIQSREDMSGIRRNITLKARTTRNRYMFAQSVTGLGIVQIIMRIARIAIQR